MIGKPIGVPSHLVPAATRLNRLIDNLDKGFALDSSTVRAERLPDGRIRFHDLSIVGRAVAAATLPSLASSGGGGTFRERFAVPRYLLPLVHKLRRVAKLVNRCTVVESDTIRPEMLPDGRVRLWRK